MAGYKVKQRQEHCCAPSLTPVCKSSPHLPFVEATQVILVLETSARNTLLFSFPVQTVFQLFKSEQIDMVLKTIEHSPLTGSVINCLRKLPMQGQPYGHNFLTLQAILKKCPVLYNVPFTF